MATLGKWSGGVTTLNPGTTFAAPNGLFPTQDRNDGSAYSFASSTSTLTLPSSDLADGYLIVAAFEHQDTSNGRHMPQGEIIQASGTGNFVGGPTGGYARDTSEDRAYVRCWAFVDGPSASATFQFQWKRDVDAPTGGTERSEFQVIPLFYSDIGLYSSTSAALLGGTSPNQVTGWSGTDGTNITLSSDVVSVTGDNKRYLVLGSQFFEGRGGRTQRWHGLEIDNTQENAAKAYSYYRNTSNDQNGEIFTWLLETVTATITIEQTCYRGDGVGGNQGGADIDGSTPSVGDHVLVVIELNDSAEVFSSTGSTSQNVSQAGPIDLNLTLIGDINFNDSGSFTRASDIAMNCEQAMDVLLGANISAASNSITNTGRATIFSEFTVNGTEDTDSFAGDYLRGDQSTQDTFGWSANLLNFQAVALDDDVGVSTSELSGSEGHGLVNLQAGWGGFWGINLDTLEGSADQSVVLAQPSETDTAQVIATIGGAVSVILAQPSEIDAAQVVTPVAGAVSLLLAQPSETDTAPAVTPIGGAVSILLTQPVETDTALVVAPEGGAVSVLLGVPAEIDTALVITPLVSQTVLLALASETDTALVITPVADEVVILALASETDTAQVIDPVGGPASVAITLASETDTTPAIVPVGGAVDVGLALPAEIDTAFIIVPVAGGVSIVLDLPLETDTAPSVTPIGGAVNVNLALSQETDSAIVITPVLAGGPQTVVVVQPFETDTGLVITPIGGAASRILGLALETDTAIAITPALDGAPGLGFPHLANRVRAMRQNRPSRGSLKNLG